ncbi:CPBP family intramembrane metalloprotease [Lacticaseibacillus pabuli]|uniref:CPBP family intramembrane metalloprotease n=1 Tax=Lacticaseibacillus pabuli TaxID=3025672 RepID=A0ABY7WSG3_9LACO|nr:CPBP family intramembrane glutamic endopeptidase [Lacticaseibacillus sp. KACC 23028]WDF82676.1 CPBP family intramembrane metalloprotease [Lacticaseibacillus sp. KACC 23028]
MTFKYLKNRIGAIFIFALAAGSIYFYQLGIVFLPQLLKMQAGGTLPRAALEAQMRHYDVWLAGITLILAAIQISCLYWLYRTQLKRRNPLHIGRRKFRLESVFFIVLMYGLVLAANAAVLRFGTPHNQQEVVSEMTILPVTLFFLAAICGPIIEELIFRGVFMNLFWQKDNTLNFWGAVITSGLVFGLLHEPHLTPFLLLYSSLGAILAITYRYHRDLRYSIGLHMLINFFPAVAGLVRAFMH